MARLIALPGQAIISGLKGKVDFYLWKGIPCARKWPIWPDRKPYPLEKIAQDTFAYSVKSWPAQPEFLRSQFQRMAAGTPFSPRDLFMRSYLSGLW